MPFASGAWAVIESHWVLLLGQFACTAFYSVEMIEHLMTNSCDLDIPLIVSARSE